MRRAHRMISVLVAASMGLSGCNYFRPAEPEVGGAIVNKIVPDYSSPDAALTTLAEAIEDKSATNGQAAYIDGLADPTIDGQGFTATFDPVTVARFNPPPDLNWSIDREQLFYHNLSQLAAGSAFVFAWRPYAAGGNDMMVGNTATLFRTYTLQATPDNGTTLIDEARGIAELHLIQFGSKWKIVKWIDTEDSQADFNKNQRSFGFLRLSGP